jgi:hypothetical protein
MTRPLKPTGRRKRTSPTGVTYSTVCKLALALPGVEEGTSWGTPGLKVKGRFLARLKEDGESLVLRMGLLEREQLMENAPEVFYVTDHYLNYPAVLVRLPKADKALLRMVLEESWRQVAPKRLVAAGIDGTQGGTKRNATSK